jgi:Rieske 2Fe-2S family protein
VAVDRLISPTEAVFGRDPVSTEPYVSDTYFASERDQIFRREWLNVGRVEEIPRPRDFVVCDIEVCGVSLIVVRGEDGVVRAFHNVCAHRANRVVTARQGSSAAFVCRYHGWSYGLDGASKTITARDRFADLDPASCGLAAVACDVWAGFVFVNLAPQPRSTLREFLGGYADFADGYPFERCTAPVTMSYELAANWKVAVDAFQETFHLGYLHRRTMRNMYFTQDDHTGSFLSMDLFGPHRRYSVWANPDYRLPEDATVERLVSSLARNINAGAQGGEVPITKLCPGINPTRDPRWCWDNTFVFPNTVITLTSEIWIISRFWPLAVDRCRWDNITYYPKPAKASERFSREYGFAHLRDVAAEDVDTMEGSTRGMRSGAKPVINLQDSEVGIRHLLHSVEEWVDRRP